MQNAKLKAIFVTFFLAAVSMICFGQQDKETERSPKLIFNPVKDIYILGDRINSY